MFDDPSVLDGVPISGALAFLDRPVLRPGIAQPASRPEIVCEGGGCSARCGTCRAACTKVPNHHGDHYCTVHGAYPDN